jgi:hypothetical protein
VTFLDDFQLLIDNSALYNGRNHMITQSADKLYEFCLERFNEKAEKFERLEKAINPLLDDDSLIAFNYLLDQVYESHIIKVENSFSFLKPVSRIKYKDYYDIIHNPIDLETIKYKISKKKYKSRDEFLSDFELLYNNCLTYNGLNNSYTNTAQRLLTACQNACDNNQMSQLEEEISNKMMLNLDPDEHSQSGMTSLSADNNEASSSINLAPTPSMFQKQPQHHQQRHQNTLNKQPRPPQQQQQRQSGSGNVIFHRKINQNNTNFNKNMSSNFRPPQSQSQQQQSSSGSVGMNLIKKKKRNPIFSSIQIATTNKNSPRSSSDVEVDVESIDERSGAFSLLGHQHFRQQQQQLQQQQFRGQNVVNEIMVEQDEEEEVVCIDEENDESAVMNPQEDEEIYEENY